MAADISTAEKSAAVAQNTVDKGSLNRPGTTTAEKFAVRVGAWRQKNEDRGLLEHFKAKIKPIDKQKVALASERFGVKQDPNTGAKIPEGDEILRKAAFDMASKDIQSFLEKGFDKNNIPPEVVNRVVDTLTTLSPEFKAIANRWTTDALRKQKVSELLSDPNFATKVQKLYEGTLDGANFGDDQLRTILQAEVDKEAEFRTKEAEVAETNANLADAQAELAKFAVVKDPATGNEASVGESETKLRDYTQRNLENLQAVESRSAEIENLKSQIAAIKPAKTPVQNNNNPNNNNQGKRGGGGPVIDTGQYTQDQITQLTTLNNSLKTAIEAKTKAQFEIAEKARLEELKKKLPGEVRALEQQKKQKDAELTAVTKGRDKAKIDALNAKRARANQEEKFVEDVNSTWAKALEEYLDEEVSKVEEASKKVLEEEASKAKSDQDKAIDTQLTTRWDRDVEEKRGWLRKPNRFKKAEIANDFNDLMAQGPKEVVRKMLVDGGVAPAEAIKLIENKEFMEKHQGKVVEKLISRQLRVGKISDTQAERILDSEWGAGMIKKGAEKNQKLAEEVGALREDGTVDTEKLRNMREKGGPVALLAILLGAIVYGSSKSIGRMF